jgi:maltooligosyltrehalose trehalohydrolase
MTAIPNDLYPPPALRPALGAHVVGGGAATRFGAFARPDSAVAVRLFAPDGTPTATHPMRPVGGGYFDLELPGVGHGALYKLTVDDRELPDPYARFLPDGVHGPAMVIVPRHPWRHGAGVARPLGEQVIYELHVGTFSEAGDYDGVRRRLPELAALGITTLELMPLAAFAGRRGWGYDGVALYAPFAPYGTPDQLRALVDDAHGLGLSVILDVVYNHFGPAGNYLGSYSPGYFTAEIHNAWGNAPDYQHAPMRDLVLGNAVYWLTELRFDGLRLDATHAILDPSPRHLLRELAEMVDGLTPRKLLIAEDDRNESALVTDFGLDAIWADDFHHAVHVTLTGERDGYYAGYEPGASAIARIIDHGWLYEGQSYAPTGRPRGTSAARLDVTSLIYAIQNHDQVGNRALGERLSSAISTDAYCAVSTLLLFLPMTPLLFAGQEWAASSPFIYFTDHDPELGRLISEGRRREFKAFSAFSDPGARAAIPDPQDVETFQRSRLKWDERAQGEHARVLALYRALLHLRRSDPVLRVASRAGLSAEAAGNAPGLRDVSPDVLIVRRQTSAGVRLLAVNFGSAPARYADLPGPLASATLILGSDGRASLDETLPPHTAVILAA